MALGRWSSWLFGAVRGIDAHRGAEIPAEHGLGAGALCDGFGGEGRAGAARADLEAPLDREVPEARDPLAFGAVVY